MTFYLAINLTRSDIYSGILSYILSLKYVYIYIHTIIIHIHIYIFIYIPYTYIYVYSCILADFFIWHSDIYSDTSFFLAFYLTFGTLSYIVSGIVFGSGEPQSASSQ